MGSFQALKCDLCDGGLIIDDSREFAVCEFCGTKYMASTLRAKIQEIRGTVKVEGAVETTTGKTEKERLLKNTETFIRLGRIYKAHKIASNITTQFPDDYRGWFYLFQISILDILSGGYGEFDSHQQYYGSLPQSNDYALQSALELCDNQKMIHSFINELINNYGDKLHTVLFSEADDSEYNRNDYNAIEIVDVNNNKLNPKTIDTFTRWVLFSSDKTSSLLNSANFNQFRNKIAQLYTNQINNGEIIPFLTKDNRERWIIQPLSNDKTKLSQIDSSLVFNYLRQYPKLLELRKRQNKNSYDEYIKIGERIQFSNTQCKSDRYAFLICGLYVFVKYYYEGSLMHKAFLKLQKPITSSEIFMSNNLCQHCGGTFKGVFSKNCSKCGIAKDY